MTYFPHDFPREFFVLASCKPLEGLLCVQVWQCGLLFSSGCTLPSVWLRARTPDPQVSIEAMIEACSIFFGFSTYMRERRSLAHAPEGHQRRGAPVRDHRTI
jgi:hypothetical protein